MPEERFRPIAIKLDVLFTNDLQSSVRPFDKHT